MEIKDLKPGDKVRITNNSIILHFGHDKYTGRIVTVRDIEKTDEEGKIYIEEFYNNEEVASHWLPFDRLKEKISIDLPKELFEI